MAEVLKSDVQTALAILRRVQRETARRNIPRVSAGAERRILNIQALEGVCGQCPSISIRFPQGPRGSVVTLECNLGHLLEISSPVELYRRRRFLSQPPDCPGYNIQMIS